MFSITYWALSIVWWKFNSLQQYGIFSEHRTVHVIVYLHNTNCWNFAKIIVFTVGGKLSKTCWHPPTIWYYLTVLTCAFHSTLFFYLYTGIRYISMDNSQSSIGWAWMLRCIFYVTQKTCCLLMTQLNFVELYIRYMNKHR